MVINLRTAAAIFVLWPPTIRRVNIINSLLGPTSGPQAPDPGPVESLGNIYSEDVPVGPPPPPSSILMYLLVLKTNVSISFKN